MNRKRLGLVVATLMVVGAAVAAAEVRTATASFQVSAYVVPRVLANVEYRVQNLQITAADVARGYVEVPAAIRLNVRTNDPSGYLVEYALTAPELVASVEVLNGHEISTLSSPQGWMHRPFTSTSETQEWTLRLNLRSNVAPGTYPLPLTVAVQTK